MHQQQQQQQLLDYMAYGQGGVGAAYQMFGVQQSAARKQQRPAKPPAALIFNGKDFTVRSFDRLPKQFR